MKVIAALVLIVLGIRLVHAVEDLQRTKPRRTAVVLAPGHPSVSLPSTSPIRRSMSSGSSSPGRSRAIIGSQRRGRALALRPDLRHRRPGLVLHPDLLRRQIPSPVQPQDLPHHLHRPGGDPVHPGRLYPSVALRQESCEADPPRLQRPHRSRLAVGMAGGRGRGAVHVPDRGRILRTLTTASSSATTKPSSTTGSKNTSPRSSSVSATWSAANQWNILGGWFLQPDCNMPSGESFVRQVLLGKLYFRDKFGVDVKTAANLDPFGHTRGLVQILAKSGYHSYLFCRPDHKNFPASRRRLHLGRAMTARRSSPPGPRPITTRAAAAPGPRSRTG